MSSASALGDSCDEGQRSGRWPASGRFARGRRVRDLVFRLASVIGLGLIVVPTLWMVADVIARVLPSWRWSVLTTPSQGESGGLLNAILGTLVLMAGVLVLAGSVGVLAGIFLTEFSAPRSQGFLRGGYEVLAGVPSIVLGYVGYVALVVQAHWGFSLLAGLLVLSVMVVPYIAKATEGALGQVPSSYREGADALGISEGWTLRRIILPAALPGILTGLVVAMALAGGETAPLLYTAGWSDALPSAHLVGSPIGYLTYPVWTFYNQPSNGAHALSNDAALLLLVLVGGLIATARLIGRLGRRYEPRG